MKAVVLVALIVGLALANQRLAQIAEEVNAMQTTWTAGINSRFTDKDLSYIKGQLGALKGGKKLPLKKITPANDIPAEFDPSTKWPECPSLKEIRDQSECGSCWAFGAAEAATDRLCIHTKGANQKPISTQDLLTCCGFMCGMGCNGGYPSGAWDFMNTDGLVTGNEYQNNQWCSPYFDDKCEHHTTGKYRPCGATKATPKCNTTCANGATYKNDKIFFEEGYSIDDDEESLQTELMTNGPLEVAFTVYEDFMTYKSGVYQHVTGSPLGGHAVKMVGWGVENGKKYWMIANSWNEDWGFNGYFKILRGVDECGIESEGIGALPRL